MPDRVAIFGPIAALAAAALAVLAWAYLLHDPNATVRRLTDTAVSVTGGDPAAGHDIILRSGCGACHRIPGVAAARGRVGPALDDFASRATIAGILPNSAENLARFIEDPRAVDPQTAMPALGLTRDEARDVAAFLYAPE